MSFILGDQEVSQEDFEAAVTKSEQEFAAAQEKDRVECKARRDKVLGVLAETTGLPVEELELVI